MELQKAIGMNNGAPRLYSRSRSRVRSFGVIWIRISDTRSLRSWYSKGADESTLIKDSSVSLMHHDLSDLGSLILIKITPKERSLILKDDSDTHMHVKLQITLVDIADIF